MLGYLLEKRPQEIYSVELTENGFVFKIRKAFFEYLLNTISREKVKNKLMNLVKDVVNGNVLLYVILPFIRFPNFSHKSTDWKTLSECAEKISLLLQIFNWYPKEEDLSNLPQFILGDNPQLMIETGHSKERGFHSSPIEIGFSQRAIELLSNAYVKNTHLHKCEEVAHDTYFSLSIKTRREFDKYKSSFTKWNGGFTGITAMVSGGGVPNFVVPGNCACLGTSPDKFKFDRDMYSHNMDSSLQQMAMLASVVTFWNKVLKPLNEANK